MAKQDNNNQKGQKMEEPKCLYVCANCSFFQKRKFHKKNDKGESVEVTCKELGIEADGKACKSMILVDGLKLTEGLVKAKEALKAMSDDELNMVSILIGEVSGAKVAADKSSYKVDDAVMHIRGGVMLMCKVAEIKDNGHLVLHYGEGENKVSLVVPPSRVCPPPVEVK